MAKKTIDAKAFYKERLPLVEVVLLVLVLAPLYLVQAFCDATVFLSLIAAAIGFFATCILTFYYMMKGVWGERKNPALKTGLTLISFLIEIIPELDLLPADLINLGLMVYITHKEDREMAQEKAEAAAKVAMDQQRKMAQMMRANQQRVEQEEAEAEENLRAANDNQEELQPANDDDEEFEYQEAA